MLFKQIPDESSAPQFTTRPIRKAGELNLLQMAEKLLAKFIEEGDEMLVEELADLVASLHRAALQVQRAKQRKLLTKLRKFTRTNVSVK